MSKNDLIDITVDLKHETEKAYLVDPGDDDPVWVPKSQCELRRTDDGKAWELTLPEWLAEDKGLA